MSDQDSGLRTRKDLRGGDGVVYVIPYVEVNGSKTFSDEALVSIFDQIKQDNTLSTVFYGGTVRNADDFLAFVKSPSNYMSVVAVNKDITGIGWINGVSDNHAMGHFCFFRSSWGKYTQDMGQALLDYWFSFPGDDGPLFDLLIGMVPSFNARAIDYVKSLGFVELGEIPKMVRSPYRVERSGMMILHKVRDDGR